MLDYPQRRLQQMAVLGQAELRPSARAARPKARQLKWRFGRGGLIGYKGFGGIAGRRNKHPE